MTRNGSLVIERNPFDVAVHPLISHINSLPEFPALKRTSWNGFTKKQTLAIIKDWTSEPLPKKGMALIICHAGGGLIRITKSPAFSASDAGERLYAFESWERTL